MDVLIRQAKLLDQHELVNIAIKDGKIHTIARNIEATAKEEIDAQGNLVISPFVESHVHLDSALSAGNPRHNASGTLLEAIEIWGDFKETFTKEDIKQRARETIQWQIANGILKIRTHVDTTDPTFQTLEALLEVREELKQYIDLQIVAFPQDGIFTANRGDELLEEALKMGADVVGGMPQVEFTREDGIRSIETIFQLANKYDKLIDIHTDETGDEQSRFAEVIAKEAIIHRMDNRVAISHATAMHNYSNDYAAKLIRLLHRANVHVVTNPTSNALLQNRLDGYPRKRGHTRVDELLAANVNVSIGNDNIMDPFGPLGKGSMLQAAHLLAHTAHLSGSKQVAQLFQMITTNGAKTLHDDSYGIAEQKQADLIVLDAKDELEAIRLTSECIAVIRQGNIISKTIPAKRTLMLNEHITSIDFKR